MDLVDCIKALALHYHASTLMIRGHVLLYQHLAQPPSGKSSLATCCDKFKHIYHVTVVRKHSLMVRPLLQHDLQQTNEMLDIPRVASKVSGTQSI